MCGRNFKRGCRYCRSESSNYAAANGVFNCIYSTSGDRSYNPDTIKKYVISGNYTIPGASTVHFDEIAREKIFESIDKIKGMKAIIRESYITLKNCLGRVPYLLDFYEHGEIDPLVIIREYKMYQTLLESMEQELYIGKISEQEALTLEYLSKTVVSGIRPYELEILKRFLNQDAIDMDDIIEVRGMDSSYVADVVSASRKHLSMDCW